MTRQKKNNLIVYGLVTIIVLSFLYLLFNKRSEGFAVDFENKSTDPTKLIYETSHVTSGDSDVKVPGNLLVGKTIKDFYVEFKACNGNWYRSSVCGIGKTKSPLGCKTVGKSGCTEVSNGETTAVVGPNQAAGNFDQNTTDRGYVVFESDGATRLRSSYMKKSGISNMLIRDCPQPLGDTSTLTKVSLPDTISTPSDGNLLVPYTADASSMIKADKGLIFKKVRELTTYGNDPGGCGGKGKEGRINTGVSPNIRITILV